MAENTSKQKTTEKTTEVVEQTDAGNEVPRQGDHDRVQMLSLRADGTPDQHNPEIIGDPQVAKAATREQFVQQAVSAADVVSVGGGTTVDNAPQDPSISEAQQVHEAAASAAEAAADATVNALSSGSDDKS